MREWMSELLKLYREGNTTTTTTANNNNISNDTNKPNNNNNLSGNSGTSDKPVKGTGESVRAKNELLLLLCANNLPSFTESEPFREYSTVHRIHSLE